MRKFVLALVVTAFAPMASQPSSAAPSPGSIDVKAVAPLAEDATFYRRRYDYDYYPRYRYYDNGYYPRYRYYDYGGYYPRRYHRNYYYRPYRHHYYRRYWY